ncbi:MAG: NAD(P)H-dependent oxidoreductase subunit E [Gammaproteobacteria bacterium]|nr:NAD(P)H-dependent oxidoreductase subunit E [Gammaproteobacteria bacterium]
MAESESKSDATARENAVQHRDQVGGVLTVLRENVGRFGYVSRTQEHDVAEVFNLSRAEVRGIVSFYHDLKTKPQPSLQVRVCQAEACQSVGARELTKRVETHLGVKLGETTDAVSLDAVYCLGLCAQAPSMMINGRSLARADLCDLAEEIPA